MEGVEDITLSPLKFTLRSPPNPFPQQKIHNKSAMKRDDEPLELLQGVCQRGGRHSMVEIHKKGSKPKAIKILLKFKKIKHVTKLYFEIQNKYSLFTQWVATTSLRSHALEQLIYAYNHYVNLNYTNTLVPLSINI